jgi:hypothetical protein
MKFTSLLQPSHATSIHSGVFEGSLDNGFFFFFWGEFFCHLVTKKLGMTHINDFVKKKMTK